jgi:hypothetical protein
MKQYIFLFLINPLLGFLFAIRSNSVLIVKNALFLYIIFVGATIVISSGTDADFYANEFVQSNNIWFEEGFTGAFNFLIKNFTDSSELYMPSIIFIGSYFSASKYLFTFLGSLFVAFAISRCYYIIRTQYVTNSSSIWNYLIIAFVFICGPVWSINGRFWLAFWFFLLIVLTYFSTAKIKYIYYALAIALIHNGFSIAICILFLYVFTYKYFWAQKLYIVMIIFAYLFSSFANDLIVNNSSFLGGGYERKAITYAKDVVEYQENNNGKVADSTPGFVIQRTWILKNILPLLILTSFFSLRKLKDKRLIIFYNFILLFFSFSVFFQDVPSLGGRYWFIWSFFTILFFLILYSSKIILPKVPKYLSYGIFIFCCYVGLRFELVQTSYAMVLGNPFLLSIIYEDNISIRDLLTLIF